LKGCLKRTIIKKTIRAVFLLLPSINFLSCNNKNATKAYCNSKQIFATNINKFNYSGCFYAHLGGGNYLNYKPTVQHFYFLQQVKSGNHIQLNCNLLCSIVCRYVCSRFSNSEQAILFLRWSLLFCLIEL
jgi:hypothetical protein